MPVGLTRLREGLKHRAGCGSLSPLFFPHLVFPLMRPDLSKYSPDFPPSFPLCCLSLCSLSSLCSPGLVWYHACMHHGPANKLHRVATPLPLSLSCQVEPLKHSLSSPLLSSPLLSIHPFLHLPFQPPPHSWHAPLPAHPCAPHPPISFTCAPIRAAGVISLPFVIPLHSSVHLLSAFHPPTQCAFLRHSGAIKITGTLRGIPFSNG